MTILLIIRASPTADLNASVPPFVRKGVRKDDELASLGIKQQGI